MSDRLQSAQCAAYLKALADPMRLKIVECLLDGGRSVSWLAEQLNVDISKVSHHLQVMLHADIVSVEREGKFGIYSLNPTLRDRAVDPQQPQGLEFGCCRIELSPKKGN